MKKNPLRKNFSLIFALFLLFLGGSLLLWTVASIPYALTIIPIFLVCIGVLGLYYYFSNDNEISLFTGMSSILLALFLFIKQNFPTVYLKSYWPIFPLIFGLALLFFSLQKNRRRRIATLVPAIVFIFLSLLFLPFSLGIMKIRFMDFIKIWWPSGFLVLGVVLLISHFRRSKKNSQDD